MSLERPSQNEILSLSKNLISIPSVTGNHEAMDRVLNLAKDNLEGFAYEEFVEPNTGVRSLLFFNTDSRPDNFRIILNGHLDVVSARPEQFNPYVSEGRLYGRGASDMKGGAAVELLTFRNIARNVPYPIGLQLVTDEETGGFNGTGYQVAQGVRSDMVISGESTELDINNERKGVFVLEVTTHGKSAHAAYLHQGDNAVVKMARLVTNLSSAFPIPQAEDWVTTMNVSGIHTPNQEHNKVPDISTAIIDFRHIPLNTKPELIQLVRSLAAEGTNIRVNAEGFAPYTDPLHPDLVLLAQCIESATGRPANFIRKAGSSDSRHFAEKGSVSVDFGPSGAGLHTDVEYGIIDSYEQYAAALTEFLSLLK